METIRKTFRLHRVQAAFRRSTATYRAFCGGRGAGKTHVGAYDLIRRAKRNRTYMVGSPTGIMLADTTFPTFKAIALELGVWWPAGVKLTPYPNVRLSTGAEVRFRTAEDPERMRGPNLSGVWLDEASLMVREVYAVVIGCLREKGEQGFLSATFTPKGMAHWTYSILGKPRPDTEIFYASTRANPFNPPEFYAQLKRQYPAETVSQELEGLFIDSDDAWQVIPTAWVQAAQARWTETPPAGLSAVGVDVARGGADQTVLARRHGIWIATMERHDGKATTDGQKVAALVANAVRGTGALVNIDVIGIGASAYDFCAETGWIRAHPINFASGTDARDSTGQLGFQNLRAFAYWSVRELLDPQRPEAERLILPPDPELLADLTAARWSMGLRGVKIEPKEKIIERLGRSPDVGDAVALSVLLPGPGWAGGGGEQVAGRLVA